MEINKQPVPHKVHMENFTTKIFIPIIIFGLTVIIFYTYNPETHYAVAENFNMPKEIPDTDIDKYVDAIFMANKEENINNNTSFQEITDLLILNTLDQKLSVLGMSKNEKEKIITSYKNFKTEIIDIVHKEMVEKNNFNPKTDISYEHLDSINGLSESIANISCHFIGIPLKNPTLKITQFTLKNTVIDTKCEAILTKPIDLVINKLKEKGAIKDTNIITSKFQDRIRASILKLASVQDTINFEVNNTEKRDFDFLGIEFSQESQLSAKVKATIVAGFDLSSFKINVDHTEKTVSIHLPEPTIISSTPEISFQAPNIEAFAPKIDSSTYNKLNSKAKENASKEAKTGKIFDEAKKNAHTSITNIFQPLMALPQFNYTVDVYFDQDIYLDKDIKNKTIIPNI